MRDCLIINPHYDSEYPSLLILKEYPLVTTVRFLNDPWQIHDSLACLRGHKAKVCKFSDYSKSGQVGSPVESTR
ncbi:MAG TPA: hypothetical protein DIW81_25820 [Planctomycetaceae bacterium]|nr:hypothetical protein [Rubinisphaera sp.]HCS54963.1 hypothetical protein [Planctomycetaceae bacterium]